jgi:ABC-type branched-subunit amino acid transport system substrate-binding protein
MMRRFTYLLLAVALITSFPCEIVAQNPPRELSAAEERRQARLFDRHTVRMGETAFSIARGYAISPLTLAEDNPDIDLTRVKVGQVLLVRKRERGKTPPAEVALEWQQLTAETEALSEPEEAAELEPTDPREEFGEWMRSGEGERPLNQGRDYGREAEYGLDGSRMPRIAVMLPLSGTTRSRAGNDFTDFYKGAMLALEDLKAEGRSAVVTLYDSGNSREKMESIVTSAEFMDTDLIIGPVFEDETVPAVRFGEFFRVPVVSPLASMRSLGSEVLFQMTPDAASKYDKLRPLLEGDINLIVVSSSVEDDSAFSREITRELAGRSYRQFNVYAGSGDEFASLLDPARPNVVIVLAGGELAVNVALTAISSSYNKVLATRPGRPSLTVVGNSRWANFDGTSIDLNLFFKLNVRFVSNYYINRSDPRTHAFETRYAGLYGDFPSRSAFRGYDAVTLFAGALFESGFSFADRLARVGDTPIDTPYRFVKTADGRRSFVNSQWTLVSFSNDYSITLQ